jgi:hypothetical protein
MAAASARSRLMMAAFYLIMPEYRLPHSRLFIRALT